MTLEPNQLDALVAFTKATARFEAAKATERVFGDGLVALRDQAIEAEVKLRRSFNPQTQPALAAWNTPP